MYIVIATMDDAIRQEMELNNIELVNALFASVIFLLTAILATLLLSQRFRTRIAPLFPRRQSPSVRYSFDGVLLPANPNAEAFQGYDPKNPVHMLALIFCVYLLGYQFGSFLLAGGLEGVAENIGVSWASIILQFLLIVTVPVLGVGLLMRRSWSQVRERLGFTNFSFESAGVGFGLGILMFMGVWGVAIFWVLLTSPTALEEQSEASRALADSISTIWLVLAVSFTAAVGEEIAFRGALQPIFGLWATAIIFSLTHIQYTLTPAVVIIFFVAIGLGWLRQHYNLYAAIIAHFCYNFIQLALYLLSQNYQ